VDNLELLLNIKTTGQELLAKIAAATNQIASADKAATVGVRDLNAALSQTQSAANHAIVGLGSLMQSARNASAELKRAKEENDAFIRQFERQAQLQGKTGKSLFEAQRFHALEDFSRGKNFVDIADVQRINKAFDAMAGTVGRVNDNLGATIIKSQLVVEGLRQVVGFVKEYTIEAGRYAARTEMLGVVTEQLARVNNLSQGAVLSQADAVRRLGITQQEALNTTNRMIFAQLDVAKATDTARLAQDAARIAGQNSSEALNGIIHGIVTRQPEVLRTYGIVVNFEQEYAKAARELGRELVPLEKTQIAHNVVLEQAHKITGVYAATLLTTGGRMQSMQRQIEDAKNAIGQAFVPVLGTAVDWLTKILKLAQENSKEFSQMAGAIGGAGTAFGVLAMLPVPWWANWATLARVRSQTRHDRPPAGDVSCSQRSSGGS
jgi:hypothetical protein